MKHPLTFIFCSRKHVRSLVKALSLHPVFGQNLHFGHFPILQYHLVTLLWMGIELHCSASLWWCNYWTKSSNSHFNLFLPGTLRMPLKENVWLKDADWEKNTFMSPTQGTVCLLAGWMDKRFQLTYKYKIYHCENSFKIKYTD